MQVEYRIKPPGKVLDRFYRDRARCTFIMGPLGSGKTIQTCSKIFKLMCEQEPNAKGVRPSRWIAVRNTYPDLLTTTAKDWLELYGDLGRYVQSTKEPPHQNLYFRLEDGSYVKAEMIFLAMDREDHVKKLRGVQATGFWLNEAKELPKSAVDMADLRHGRYPSLVAGDIEPTWHGMVGDTNAPDVDHWYYEMAEESPVPDWVFYRQPGGVIKNKHKQWVPNPEAENLENLPDDYYVKGMQKKKEEWILVNLANEYGPVYDGKPVYTQFNSAIHVGEFNALKDVPLLFGWDFGLTPACIIGQLLPSGQLRILDEITTQRSGIKQLGVNVVRPHLNKNYKGFYIGMSIGDPAGEAGADTDEKTCIDTLSDEYVEEDPMLGGVGIITQSASSNSLERRINAVSSMLSRLIDGAPAIIIHKRCKTLIKGFLGGYQYDRVKVSGDRFKDQPAKNDFSHPHDALQYLCMGVEDGFVFDSNDEDYYDDYRDEEVSVVTGY